MGWLEKMLFQEDESVVLWSIFFGTLVNLVLLDYDCPTDTGDLKVEVLLAVRY